MRNFRSLISCVEYCANQRFLYIIQPNYCNLFFLGIYWKQNNGNPDKIMVGANINSDYKIIMSLTLDWVIPKLQINSTMKFILDYIICVFGII